MYSTLADCRESAKARNREITILMTDKLLLYRLLLSYFECPSSTFSASPRILLVVVVVLVLVVCNEPFGTVTF